MIALALFLGALLCLATLRRRARRTVEMLGRTPRSPRWRKVRNLHLASNPRCAICGSAENLVVHHIKSFSENPELELCPENLITLCENRNLNCHFVFGHHMRWADLNYSLVDNLANIRRAIGGGRS